MQAYIFPYFNPKIEFDMQKLIFIVCMLFCFIFENIFICFIVFMFYIVLFEINHEMHHKLENYEEIVLLYFSIKSDKSIMYVRHEDSSLYFYFFASFLTGLFIAVRRKLLLGGHSLSG